MRISLPARTQAAQVEDLLTTLRAVDVSEPLEVDASAVTHVDFAGVQLVLSLRRTHPTMRFTSSAAIDEALDQLSLSPGGGDGTNPGSR